MLAWLTNDIEDYLNRLYLFPALGYKVSGNLLNGRKLLTNLIFTNGDILRDTVIQAQTTG
ncbi:MAG: hypothetical protein PUK64_07940 [bacterium]|nr:hypothetical protein [bacterium]